MQEVWAVHGHGGGDEGGSPEKLDCGDRPPPRGCRAAAHDDRDSGGVRRTTPRRRVTTPERDAPGGAMASSSHGFQSGALGRQAPGQGLVVSLLVLVGWMSPLEQGPTSFPIGQELPRGEGHSTQAGLRSQGASYASRAHVHGVGVAEDREVGVHAHGRADDVLGVVSPEAEAGGVGHPARS